MKIGIDIGGSHIAIAQVVKDQLINKEEIDISIINKENAGEILEHNIINQIERIKGNESIELIGIGSPGNPKGGIITNLYNLGLKEVNIEEMIKKHYNTSVILKNDAKCAGLAEKTYGTMKEYNDGVFLAIGTGIGSAIFLNNELLTANRNVGFEIGHTIIQKNGLQCNCGKSGCFETYCSMKAFKNNIKDALNIPEPLSGKAYVELIQNNINKKEVEKVINEYIDNLIIGLSNIVDVFEPQVICLGGGFVHYKDILYDRLIDEFNKRKYVFNKDSLPEIKLAILGNDAGIIGAVI